MHYRNLGFPMRRYLTLAVPVILWAMPIHAQSTASVQTIRVVMLAGMNQSSLASESGFQSRNGPLAGGGLSLPLSGSWNVETDLLFSSQGADSKSSDGSLVLSYLQVPLTLRYTAPVTGSVRPFIQPGAFIAYQSSCSVEARTSGVSASASCETIIQQAAGTSARTKSIDFGGVVGAGVAFDMNGRLLTVGLRYAAGINGWAETATSNNHVLSLLGSLEIPIAGW